MDKKEHILEQTLVQNSMPDFGPPPPIKRQRLTPPLNERVMLYVRQENEDVYTPLHVVPPTLGGLLNAVSLLTPPYITEPYSTFSSYACTCIYVLLIMVSYVVHTTELHSTKSINTLKITHFGVQHAFIFMVFVSTDNTQIVQKCTRIYTLKHTYAIKNNYQQSFWV